MKKLTLNVLMAALCLAPYVGRAQSTVFVAPTNKVGAALAEGVTQTLVRRGFAMNDPRIAETISSIGSRAAVDAAAAGSGATWMATISRLSPWVLAGLAVYQGVTWYMDSTGKVYLAPPGSTTTAPVFSNGLVSGQYAWTAGTGYFGSPQEALSYLFYISVQKFPDAKYGVPTLTQNSATQYTAQYNYSIPSQFLTNMSGTKTVTATVWSGISCPAGSGVDSSVGAGCVSAGLASSPWAGSPVQGYDMPTAYSNLPSAAKAAALSPDLAAETANRLWADAAVQPGYEGVPWSSSAATTAADFAPYEAAEPTYWPTTTDWGTTAVPTSNAITSPDTNPNAVSSASSAPAINLGADPGTSAPTLDSPPDDLFKPISDLTQPWLTWQVPSHSSTCPTWQGSPSIGGQVFLIDLSYHCTVAEQYRPEITVAALACWVVIAAFIVLAA